MYRHFFSFLPSREQVSSLSRFSFAYNVWRMSQSRREKRESRREKREVRREKREVRRENREVRRENREVRRENRETIEIILHSKIICVWSSSKIRHGNFAFCTLSPFVSLDSPFELCCVRDLYARYVCAAHATCKDWGGPQRLLFIRSPGVDTPQVLLTAHCTRRVPGGLPNM